MKQEPLVNFQLVDARLADKRPVPTGVLFAGEKMQELAPIFVAVPSRECLLDGKPRGILGC